MSQGQSANTDTLIITTSPVINSHVRTCMNKEKQ